MRWFSLSRRLKLMDKRMFFLKIKRPKRKLARLKFFKSIPMVEVSHSCLIVEDAEPNWKKTHGSVTSAELK
jgi:hypothetical protein